MPTVLPFGERAARFIRRPPEQDALLNILVGAVRSSKTFAVNAKIVSWLATGWWPGGTGLITGKSKTSIKTNMLNDIFSMVGKRNYHYNSASGELTLFKRPFIVVGAADESRHQVIKGMTCGLWIADEATLYPKSFFDMAMSRLSLRGSRAYATTNPADPYHYLKTEWIDNEEKLLNGDVWFDRFTLDDNPNIDDNKKEALKRMFTGVFRLRNIEGAWVIAEGSIFREVMTEDIYYTDAERPIGLLSSGGHIEHWLACDYGTINPCVFLDIYDNGDVLFVEREAYWDSRSMMRQKTDREYADDLLDFIGRGTDQRTWPGVILDPSAASFRAELRSRGLVVLDADNEVIDGIRKVSTLLNRKKIRINRNCKNTIQEMTTYAWNEKRAENGMEQPIKANDHTCDALRYHVNTRINNWRIAA